MYHRGLAALLVGVITMGFMIDGAPGAAFDPASDDGRARWERAADLFDAWRDGDGRSMDDLVRLMTLRQGQANLVEVTLPAHTPLAGAPVRALKLPHDSALVTILRGGRVIIPQADDSLEAGDELLARDKREWHTLG